MIELTASSQKALAALWRLADGAGRVSVARRSDLLKASRLPRGTWDRAIKGLVLAGLVTVEARPANRREPRCYRLPRATTSHETSHDEPRTDLVVSSSIPETKDQQQGPDSEDEPSHDEPRTESPAALAILSRMLEAWERSADAQERLVALAEAQASKGQSQPGQVGTAPSCKCGLMVVRSKGDGSGQQFYGCPEYPRGCGAPTISLRSSAALAESSGFHFAGRNTTVARLSSGSTSAPADPYAPRPGESLRDAVERVRQSVRGHG